VVGRGVDSAFDPFTWVPRGYGLLTLNWARNGLGIVDLRATYMSDLEHVKATALDPYATFRSLYRQSIDSQVEEARHPADVTAPAGPLQPAQ
jgi:phospholipid-binding lipoprotein MlaA